MGLNVEPRRNDEKYLHLLRRVSVRQLIYFERLAHFLNFRKAAADLQISQPTLSQQMHQLEQSLELTLFDRSSNGTSLTACGETLHQTVNSMLDTFSAAMTTLHAARQQALSIAIPSYQSYPQIQCLLRVFHQDYPQAVLHVHEMTAQQMCAALDRGDICAAFLSIPAPLELSQGVEIRIIHRVAYQLCLAKSHALAQSPTLLPAQVGTLPMILLPREQHPVHFDHQVAGFVAMGVRPVLHPASVTNVSGQIGLAASGVGACLVAPGTLDLPESVVLRPTEPALSELQLALVSRKQDFHPYLEQFLATVAQLFPV